jgi:alpha-tubulin suppressor-like RCC1 family protein
MRTSIRRWLALGAGVGFVLVACGDTAEEQKQLAGIAQGCTLNSDCNNPLVCAFQRCHEACVETRDCPQGQRCVAGEDGTNVCQLPDDVDCTTSSGCNGSQVCAVDRECRDACSGENDCIGDQVCATSGACAEPDEVDDDGDLPPSGGTGGMGGTTGTGGSSNGGTGNAGTGNGGTAGMSGEGGDTGEGGEDTGGTSGSSGNAGQGGTQPTGGSAGSGMGGMSAGRGGMAGNAGSNAAAGAGGASAGMGGLSGAGAGGTSGAGAGSGGAAGSAGNGGTSGTGGTAPSACIQQLYGDYALRTDGRLLYQTTTQQIPILDSATATPLTNITSVLTGVSHGCASRSDGSAWCWATTNNGNAQGQLGDGGNSVASLYRATRVRTSASTFLENVSSVANGASYSLNTSCAVSAGTVWCWGILNDITNNGATLYSPYAVQVTVDGVNPLTNVVAVAVSYGHACALVRPSTTNEVWCWGDNASGEAGNGLQTRVRYPTKVIGVTNPSQVVLSAESTMALEGNRVKCWGRNAFQECGTADTTSPVLAPTVVKVMGGAALDGATALGGGSSEGCVVRSDQSLWCWGNQFNGYAAPFLVSAAPVTGVTHVGTASTQARFMTSDGKYHIGPTVRDPNCNALD